MTYPWILWKYVAKNSLYWLSSVTVTLTCIISIFEIVELSRRASGKAYIGFSLILKLVFLKIPVVIEQILPLIVFFSSFLCIRSLNKRLELVVMRSSGLSMIQLVFPFLAVITAFSCAYLLIINPLSSSMFSKFEHLEQKLFKPHRDTLSLVRSGLWFKKAYKDGKVIIHGKRALKDTLQLQGVTLYFFDHKNNFTKRLDAQEAFIKKKKLILKNPWEAEKKDWSLQHKKDKLIPIELSVFSLEESFTSPKAIPFYQLPRFINSMEKLGFSVMMHKSHWYRLLGAPFLYLAMVLWAAFFSLSWYRQQNIIKTLGTSCLAVFSLYILNEIMRSLGMSGVMSPGWSVILSVGLTFFSGCGLLLHLQEK